MSSSPMCQPKTHQVEGAEAPGNANSTNSSKIYRGDFGTSITLPTRNARDFSVAITTLEGAVNIEIIISRTNSSKSNYDKISTRSKQLFLHMTSKDRKTLKVTLPIDALKFF